MGIRVVVLDDNPHVSWEGRVHPVNATFHRFLAGVLDVPGPAGRPAIESIVHAVPLRPAAEPPRTLPLDERLRVVGTAPFDGIADFLRHAPSITRRNAPVLRAAMREADLAWLKVPASNAPLAAWLARRAGVARFVYVAGRASDVVAGQARGPASGLAARLVAAAYDAAGRLVSVGGRRVVVGEGIGRGDGLVTSLVELGEIRTRATAWPADPSRLHLAWAGRLAAGKGLESLLEALSLLPARVDLTLIGDGLARAALAARAGALGLSDRVAFAGYIAERGPYLDRLAAADVFVFPSPAEGFPKAVLDAMAVGLPVVASRAGALDELAAAGSIAPVPAGAPAALAGVLTRLERDPAMAHDLRRRGTALATAHTRSGEAAALVAAWRRDFPHLPWA